MTEDNDKKNFLFSYLFFLLFGMLDGKTLLEVQMERNKSCHWNYNKHNHKRQEEKYLRNAEGQDKDIR